MEGNVRLVSETCTIDIDKVVLDTGLAFDVVAPAEAIAAELVPYHRRQIIGVGGTRQRCDAAFATLELGPWRIQVEVVLVSGETTWMIGAPILKAFDLLLRTVPYRRAAIEGPDRPLPLDR